MYANGDGWQSWMQDYKFGALAFIPGGDPRLQVDDLRNQYDPISARTSMAHITLTQPFSRAPKAEEINLIQTLIKEAQQFNIKVGPVTTSPNKRLLWLAVNPQENILTLRENLHSTGLFRTDLPLTKGFIPHMTLSEKGREPEEVETITSFLNNHFEPQNVSFSAVTWIVPNENFVFQEHRDFQLKFAPSGKTE